NAIGRTSGNNCSIGFGNTVSICGYLREFPQVTLAHEQGKMGHHGPAKQVFPFPWIISARELICLISRTALVRDPYAGWCGRAPQ
ncbi:hypothetical protein, partial [Desulfocicer niacini]